MKKKIIWSVVIVLIGGLIWFFSSRDKKKEYVTEKVSYGNVEQVISVTGEIVSKNEAVVSSETGGQIEEIFVKVGDYVSDGQKIVDLDDSVLYYQLQEAREALREAEEAERLARREWKKIKPEERAAAVAATNQARHAVSVVKKRIAKMTLRSPIEGVVSEINFDKGEVVAANGNVATIIQNDKLEISADVPESDIAELKLGQIADLEFDAFDFEGDEDVMQAKIVQIYPAATIIQDVVYYTVKLEILGDEERIKPGMSVDIDVLISEKKGVLTVPNQAITSTDGKRVVKILNEEGMEEEREVEIGMRGDNGMTEIISGLKEGDEVIVLIKEE